MSEQQYNATYSKQDTLPQTICAAAGHLAAFCNVKTTRRNPDGGHLLFAAPGARM
jgi:hypothetical protein